MSNGFKTLGYGQARPIRQTAHERNLDVIRNRNPALSAALWAEVPVDRAKLAAKRAALGIAPEPETPAVAEYRSAIARVKRVTK